MLKVSVEEELGSLSLTLPGQHVRFFHSPLYSAWEDRRKKGRTITAIHS